MLRKYRQEDVPISDLQCEPTFWGLSAQPRIRSWLLEHYDRHTMPPLAVAEIKGKEGYWLLGWDHEDTQWPPLLEMIFGKQYADNRLALNRTSIDLQEAIDKYGIGQYGATTDRKGRR